MSKLKDDHGKDARKNDSLLHFLTTQYKTAAKKGCQATLEMAAIIVRAHDALEKTLLPAFYEDIGLAPDGSKARKLKRIGELAKNSARLQPYLEKLPSAWTTLYELTKLESDQFQRIMDSDAAQPLATWAELKAVIESDESDESNSSPVRLHYHFNLDLVPVRRRREFVDRLNKLCAVLKDLGYAVDRVHLDQAIHRHFPDLRAIANRLEFEPPKRECADSGFQSSH